MLAAFTVTVELADVHTPDAVIVNPVTLGPEEVTLTVVVVVTAPS